MRLNNNKANIFRQTWGCPKNLHNIQICVVWLSWGPQLDSQNHVYKYSALYSRASHAPERGFPQLHRWKSCCCVHFSSIETPAAYAARGVDSPRYLVWLLTPRELRDIAERRWVCFGIFPNFGIVCEYFSLRIHRKMFANVCKIIDFHCFHWFFIKIHRK